MRQRVIPERPGLWALMLCVFVALASPTLADGPSQRVASASPLRADAGRELFSQGPSWLQMLDNQEAARNRANATGGQSDAEAEDDGHWSDFLPLWGRQYIEGNVSFPPPIGISVLAANVDQRVRQENFKLSFSAGTPPASFDDLVSFSSERAVDTAVGVRVDAFVLPFFNLYAIGGYNTGNTEFDLTIQPIPILVPMGMRVKVEESHHGVLLGGGGTLALGWKNWFWMADGNGSWSKGPSTDNVIVAGAFSTRAGWQGKLKGASLAVYVGTMYLNYTQTVETSVPIPGGPTLFIELDVESQDPWNMLLGGSMRLYRNWEFTIEGGFIGRKQVTGMIGYRF